MAVAADSAAETVVASEAEIAVETVVARLAPRVVAVAAVAAAAVVIESSKLTKGWAGVVGAKPSPGRTTLRPRS